jgi:hypothetical protein
VAFEVIEFLFVKFNAGKNFSSGFDTTARNRKGSCTYFLHLGSALVICDAI